MNDSIVSYINKSKINLNTIIECLDKNIEFLDNDLWIKYYDIKDEINDIVSIYYDRYFLNNSIDFSKINKYISFNNKINRRLKAILLSIIDYYDEKDEGYIITEKEGSILYLNILIYLAYLIYNKSFGSIDTPKKIEKVINNIIDNFQKIRFRKEKDLNTLIKDIEKIVLENNMFDGLIKNLSNEKNHNVFININPNTTYYKVIYEYDIDDLESFDEKDIKIVNNMLNIGSVLTSISFDLCYYASFDILRNGLDKKLLFPINKKQLMNLDFIKYIQNKHKEVLNNISFLVTYDEIRNDYDFVNMIREKDIDIYIEVKDIEETNNYNMFMDNKNIIIPEEFLSLNEKYVEIWKDMGVNFIIKNYGSTLTFDELINRKRAL